MKNNQLIRNAAILVVAAILCTVAGMEFNAQHQIDTIYEGNPNLSEKRMLSDYSPDLKGTESDTPIYIFKGDKPGGSMLIMGGTHTNEVAAVASAMVYVENAKVEAGTLYVIPRANASAFTHTTPLLGQMGFAEFTLSDGSERSIRLGSRLSNPVHQWPDPNYYNGTSGRELRNEEVAEVRNLNRNHPGDANGTMTEKVNYGIYNLITTEKIDIAYDGHEAGPGFQRVDYLIAHDRAMAVGSSAVMNNNINGLPFAIDLSGKSSYGLSHRSLGDNTEAMMTLFETNNPVMGFNHGKITRRLVIDGIDDNYKKLTDMGFYVQGTGAVTADGAHLKQRTAYHNVMCFELTNAFTDAYPEKPIIVSGMPTYDDFMNKGLEGILKPVVAQ